MPPPKRASRQKMLPLPISPPENAVSQQAPPQIAAGQKMLPLAICGGAAFFSVPPFLWKLPLTSLFHPDILNFMNKKERENPWT